MTGYYASWYKTGNQPCITSDKIFIWGRAYSTSLTIPGDSLGAVGNADWVSILYTVTGFAVVLISHNQLFLLPIGQRHTLHNCLCYRSWPVDRHSKWNDMDSTSYRRSEQAEPYACRHRFSYSDLEERQPAGGLHLHSTPRIRAGHPFRIQLQCNHCVRSVVK